MRDQQGEEEEEEEEGTGRSWKDEGGGGGGGEAGKVAGEEAPDSPRRGGKVYCLQRLEEKALGASTRRLT